MQSFPKIGDEVIISKDHPSPRVRGVRGTVSYVNEKLDEVEVWTGVWEWRCTRAQVEPVVDGLRELLP